LIAEALQQRQLDEFFTAGLFLEIGILHGARSDLSLSAEIARMPSAHRASYERACGRQDHMQIGAALARSFKLPPEMADAVLYHHAATVPATGVIARVAWVAERFAGAFEAADLQRAHQEALAAASAVGITAAVAEDILSKIPPLVAEAGSAFMRDLPAQEDIDALMQQANRRLVDMNRTYERLMRQLEQLVADNEQLTDKLRQANDELSKLAATDPLTGLSNRRSFVEALRRDVSRAQRTSEPLCVLILDVDHFKSINDTHGHGFGDFVLQRISDVLRSTLRTGDLPARWGGEEFVALLPASPADVGQIVAERVRAALEGTPIAAHGKTVRVTASFGVAAFEKDDSPDPGRALIDRADAALYEAKRTGRNKVVVAAPKP
jgi:diguanylate cyclase (GGDEF)-like protein